MLTDLRATIAVRNVFTAPLSSFGPISNLTLGGSVIPANVKSCMKTDFGGLPLVSFMQICLGRDLRIDFSNTFLSGAAGDGPGSRVGELQQDSAG